GAVARRSGAIAGGFGAFSVADDAGRFRSPADMSTVAVSDDEPGRRDLRSCENATSSVLKILTSACKHDATIGPTNTPQSPIDCTPPRTLTNASKGCNLTLLCST